MCYGQTQLGSLQVNQSLVLNPSTFLFPYFRKLNGGIVLLVFGTIIFIIGLICFVLIICVSERVDGDAGDDQASDDTEGTPVSGRVVIVVCRARTW